MTYDRTRHHRRSIRLKGYDYATAGAYFITICTQDRARLFGDIVNDEMQLNESGRCVARWWEDIPHHFAPVNIDAFVVMPNHVHGIIVISDAPVGAGSPRPDPRTVAAATDGMGTALTPTGMITGRTTATNVGSGGAGTGGAGTAPLRRPALGNVVAYFKYQSAKYINALLSTPGAPVWQRNYYEHIIRNEALLKRVRQYVADNPARWAFDRENPSAAAPEPENAWRTRPY